MTVMWLGLMRDPRKICQDFSRAMPHSTDARAAARARLTVRWPELFPAAPRPAQQALLDAAPADGPLLTLIEIDTGGGKTEMALWLAHRLAARCGYHGLYLAQATRAASEQLTRRVSSFLVQSPGRRRQANLALVHGTASASPTAHQLTRGSRRRVAAELTASDCTARGRAVLDRWFLQALRGLCSPFGVGTVDQVVLAAQKSRHWCLRLFALVNKVVIIDEAHAYELYQQKHLADAVSWIADAGSSVIVLSATLPRSTRALLIQAWCAGHRTTPTPADNQGPITFVDARGTITHAHPATTERLHTDLELCPDPGPDALARQLLTEHSTGGITGVIRNTIGNATALYTAAQQHAAAYGWDSQEIVLLHGRFFEKDRLALQNRLLLQLGPHPDDSLRQTRRNPHRPRRLLVIATQVLEQSLDIGFDLLYSDLAPIDYLIQRRGREWRHLINHLVLPDQAPLMRVLWTPGPDGLPLVADPKGRPTDVYAPYILLATWHALHRRARHNHLRLVTPDDTQSLLDAVYDSPPAQGTGLIHELLAHHYPQWLAALKHHEDEASARSIAPYNSFDDPCTVEDLASGSHGDADDPSRPSHLIALSRLGEPSLEVIGLYEQPEATNAGNPYTWDPQGDQPADLTAYDPDTHPEERRLQQHRLLLNTVRIPARWCSPRGALPPRDSDAWKPLALRPLKGRHVFLLTPDGKSTRPEKIPLSYHPTMGLSHPLRTTQAVASTHPPVRE